MQSKTIMRSTSTKLLALGLLASLAAFAPIASAGAHGASKSEVVTRGSLSVKGGKANVALDPTATAALTGFGVSLSAVAPATVTGANWMFPVASGEIRYMTRAATGSPATTRITGGLVKLSGGITATRKGKSVTLTNLRGELWEGMNGRIEATVSGVKHSIDALMLTEPAIDPVKKTASAKLRLTGVAARALNKVLATTVFKGGQLVATVSVTAP